MTDPEPIIRLLNCAYNIGYRAASPEGMDNHLPNEEAEDQIEAIRAEARAYLAQ